MFLQPGQIDGDKDVCQLPIIHEDNKSRGGTQAAGEWNEPIPNFVPEATPG